MTTSTVSASVVAFKNRFASVEFCALDSWINQDEDGFCSGMGHSKKPRNVSLDNLVTLFTPSGCRDDWNLDELLDSLQTIEEVKDAYADSCDNECASSNLFEKNELLNKISEQERVRLEREASLFARKHKTGGVNVLFLKKIDDEIRKISQEAEDWNNPECRAERYGMGSPEQFYSDNDYMGGLRDAKEDHLVSILGWVETNLPLLWAKYQESK